MTSPPLTIREYAYFSVTGSGKHELVTKRLGIEPSEAWNKGDKHPQSGRVGRFMRWVRSSGIDDKAPIQQHIENLLLFLFLKEEEIRELATDYELVIHCVGYFPPSGHGTHLSRDVVRKAARLSICFDLDYYYVDDHGHDV